MIHSTDGKPVISEECYPAPVFWLQDTENSPWGLEPAAGKGPAVVVFYYGYYCPHCVSQLFGLSRDHDKFRSLGASVVAVSADAPEDTRERFRENGGFPFPVLSDPGLGVARMYGLVRDGGDLMHGAFVVGRDYMVHWGYAGDVPFADNETLLRKIASIEKKPYPS